MSAAVGVWKRTKGTLTDVLTIPDASGVLAVVDCWATTKVAVTITVSSNNNPVFFILPPPPNRFGDAQAISLERQGLQPKVTSAQGWVKVTRVFGPPAPKVFSKPFANLNQP